LPHPPQFASLSLVLTHTPLHSVYGQVAAHAPAVQMPLGQVTPHAPQLTASREVSTHLPPHTCCPDAQPHLPPEHD